MPAPIFRFPRGGSPQWVDGLGGEVLRAAFFGADAPPEPEGLLSVWTGAAWEAKPLKFWNGASWQAKPLRRWTGSAWE